jgi:hypothetical protein
MTDADTPIAELEERVQRLEDHIALLQSLSAYGPAVDSMEFDAGIRLWEEDGVYDLGDGFPQIDEGRGILYLTGPDEIRDMLEGPASKPYFEQGCAHVMSMPLIKIDGDRAVGIGYHMTYINTKDGAQLARLNSSRLEWRRQASGEWKITKRTHRLVDEREGGRALLRDSLYEITGGAPEAQ